MNSVSPGVIDQMEFLLSAMNKRPYLLLAYPGHVFFQAEAQRLVALGDMMVSVEFYAIVGIRQGREFSQYWDVRWKICEPCQSYES